MRAPAGVAELLGHAKRACAEVCATDRGPRYAAALSAQASTFRLVASLLDLEVLKASLGLADTPRCIAAVEELRDE
jgi:hypothetical protein